MYGNNKSYNNVNGGMISGNNLTISNCVSIIATGTNLTVSYCSSSVLNGNNITALQCTDIVINGNNACVNSSPRTIVNGNNAKLYRCSNSSVNGRHAIYTECNGSTNAYTCNNVSKFSFSSPPSNVTFMGDIVINGNMAETVRVLDSRTCSRRTSDDRACSRSIRDAHQSRSIRSSDVVSGITNLPSDFKEDECVDESKECSICMNANKRVALNCGHIFCATCTKKLLDDKICCPDCRKMITSAIYLFL